MAQAFPVPPCTGWSPLSRLTLNPDSSEDSNAPEVPSRRWSRAAETVAPAFAQDDHAGALARDLPETAPHATSRPHTTPPSAARLTLGFARRREVTRGGTNHPSINGMQGVRGSNPLSSTPGQRSCSASTAHESPASGSKSAAICLCEADLVVRRAVDAGQHRRCRRPVDRAPPGRRHQPGRARRRPDRPRIHSISPGALVAVLA
jgi:hypothetical protein